MNNNVKVIHWFRRDLRLADNKSLYEATKNNSEVIPIFVFDTNILKRLKNKEDRRVHFIWDGVNELQKKLKKKNSDLLILYGDPLKLVPQMAKKFNVCSVYCNEDYDPYSITRDMKVKKKLLELDIEFYIFKDHVVFSGEQILKKDGSPYKVFTPYKNEWLRCLNKNYLEKFNCRYSNLTTQKSYFKTQVKSLKDVGFKKVKTILGGESYAKKKFQSFLKKIKSYKKERDRIDFNSTSSLSPYIRFGMISTRELVREVLSDKTLGARTWLSEIIWREFYHMILFQFPHVAQSSFNPKYDKIKWPGKDGHFKKWKEGKTGFPLVDAAMIHFSRTGIMHNRLRMIVASFLVKDLLIDWKKGEKYFAKNLLDYDLAANNGGWQWSASTGCDAQPYFRVFNPITQSKKFDPDGTFIKKHLPILKKFSAKEIHFPADCSSERQKEAKCVIGKDYPHPIVKHDIQRKKAIELFK